MNLSVYRPVLAHPGARAALLLGLFVRIPLFAGGVILTLHVVGKLHETYGAAGILTTAATIALSISSPWRGRLLDRRGLRRVVVPSLVVQAVCWSLAPWAGYWALLVLAGLAGLFAVPTFSIVRQSLVAAVPEDLRRSALSLDSSATELSFMAGPALGVWLATVWDTSWALLVCEWLSIIAGIVLAVVNPALRSEADEQASDAGAPSDHPRLASWFGLPVALVLTAAAATTVVLGGSDVAIVAMLRTLGAPQHIGWVLAIWGAGSLLGGLVYGAWHRAIPAAWLLVGLAAVTAPVVFATNVATGAVLLFVSGLFCAPTITATVDQLTRLVPVRARGEAIGWHGSSMTAGLAVGAPLAGFSIDAVGWQGGFLAVSAVGLLVALACGLVVRPRGRRGRSDPEAAARSGNFQPADRR